MCGLSSFTLFDACAQTRTHTSKQELLTQNLNRLDESKGPEDQRGVYKTLGVFENLTDLSPTIATLLGEKTELVPWLLTRLEVKEFEANKLYASEILSIVISLSPENAEKFGAIDHLERILRLLASYRKQDPKGQEEIV